MRSGRSARRCDLNGCNAAHHKLLHANRNTSVKRGNRVEPEHEATNGSPIFGVVLTATTDTLLQLVPVWIRGPKGDRDVVALLDPGAQTSLCCEDVLKEVRVQGRRYYLRLNNIQRSKP